MTELHEKYAPVLHFNKDEKFFPMRVDELLRYSSLHAKNEPAPLIPAGQLTPELLQKYGQQADIYVRSVRHGPPDGQAVVSQWSESALELVLRGLQQTTANWTEELSRVAYRWFNPATAPATKLFWWNNLITSMITGVLTTARAGELPRLVLPAEMRANSVENYQSTFTGQPEYTYYYRYRRDGHYLCLQYWFFYGYNDWGRGYAGLNDHEGDWEGLHLFFRLNEQGQPQEPPAYITYATHESRLTKAWGETGVRYTHTHPEAFVGAGSHATYPQAKAYDLMEMYDLFDYATGDGATISYDQWSHRLNLDEMSWLTGYAGSWGTRYWLSTAQLQTIVDVALATVPLGGIISTLAIPPEFELPGVSAPHGPTDAHRPQNAAPVQWAGIEA